MSGAGLNGGGLTGGPNTSSGFGPLVASDGSAAAPSISFLSSLTTGFYRLAAGIIGFASAGVYSLEFQSGGVIAGGVAKLTLTTAAGTLLSYGASNANTITLDAANTTVGGTIGNIARFQGTTGMIAYRGTDSTGSPGAATIDRPSGKSSIALGASSVVITNALCSATSRVMISMHTRDATGLLPIVVPGAGSFTVSVSANATAAMPFSWEVNDVF